MTQGSRWPAPPEGSQVVIFSPGFSAWLRNNQVEQDRTFDQLQSLVEGVVRTQSAILEAVRSLLSLAPAVGALRDQLVLHDGQLNDAQQALNDTINALNALTANEQANEDRLQIIQTEVSALTGAFETLAANDASLTAAVAAVGTPIDQTDLFNEIHAVFQKLSDLTQFIETATSGTVSVTPIQPTQ